MYALNKAQIIGHLTEPPQIRQTPGGQFVGDLNIISRQSFINSSGMAQAGISYINVVVWRGLAEVSSRFLKKGSHVYVSGRIQTDSWEDQEGQKRYKTRVVADDLILLNPKIQNPDLPQGSKISGGLNQAEIIGNLTRDPEIRQTPNGDSVCSFGVATNYAWKDRMGQEQEKTEFHNIVVWGGLAAELFNNVKKGRKVYIAGRLQTRSWETPDGQKRWTTEIVADRALALGTLDAEIGAPESSSDSSSASKVTFSKPAIKDKEEKAYSSAPSCDPAAAGVIPENPSSVPDINYEPEIKPEDLPF